MNETDLKKLTKKIEETRIFLIPLLKNIKSVIVGQKAMIDEILICVLARGHVLLEGLPGLAKTRTIQALAASLKMDFGRVQFTPDLLPADLVGTQIYSPGSGRFTTRKGPVFTDILLADEINRAPAKVQSALLESMQERGVTIGDQTYELSEDFMVLATQNPIEQEGTYPLPEAQIDRFMMKILVPYPEHEEEMRIIDVSQDEDPKRLRGVIGAKELGLIKKLIAGIYVDERIHKYIVDLVRATRYPDEIGLEKHLIAHGGSPRASIDLARASRAAAYIEGRSFVTPEDIQRLFRPLLRHRIAVSFEAQAEDIGPEQMLDKIIERVDVP